MSHEINLVSDVMNLVEEVRGITDSVGRDRVITVLRDIAYNGMLSVDWSHVPRHYFDQMLKSLRLIRFGLKQHEKEVIQYVRDQYYKQDAAGASGDSHVRP
jgi:hypothetical protein